MGARPGSLQRKVKKRRFEVENRILVYSTLDKPSFASNLNTDSESESLFRMRIQVFSNVIENS